MKTRGDSRCRGFGLVECMVYIGILSIILTLGFGAFIDAVERSTRMERRAAQIVQALQAGELWRADVRLASRGARLVNTDRGTELHLQGGTNAIAYTFRDGAILRRFGETAPWLPFLEQVKESRFQAEQRGDVIGWRWEVELVRHRDEASVKPVFSFQAAIRGQ